jgi:hypothetical protein
LVTIRIHQYFLVTEEKDLIFSAIDKELENKNEKLLGLSYEQLFEFGIQKCEHKNQKIRKISCEIISLVSILELKSPYSKKRKSDLLGLFIRKTECLKSNIKVCKNKNKIS